ncbi:hypothetical protein PFTANZ_05208 [Plasmodium falciparum Tanzania (2000708)]|uniref:Uncharacterized protein n=1 Tax=Plasmodium falciparum Tanzania (2000708) TaxID=1036725 RepID=A0A024W0F4_PLAFA|nr:hypothetical protein PFTANZ_05208 [Plasmodium falciparum Tanzania (2000708)]
MRRFNTSQNKNERNLFNDYIKNEDELYDERDDEGINKEPISLKADKSMNIYRSKKFKTMKKKKKRKFFFSI